jgi:hypothetical protein
VRILLYVLLIHFVICKYILGQFAKRTYTIPAEN